MSDTFWCRGCQTHKKLISRSVGHKIGGALCCGSCEQRMLKMMKPTQGVTRDGVHFSIKSEHVRTSRIKTANRNMGDTVRNLLATCPSQ